jgi:hypothetical protein
MISKMMSVLLLSFAALAGCATKDYGQLPPLQAAAAPADCAQVTEQLVRTQHFREHVEQQSKFSGADVLAFLLDFGIGNAIAKDTALKSAELRAEELRKKENELNCSAEGSKHANAAAGALEPSSADAARMPR